MTDQIKVGSRMTGEFITTTIGGIPMMYSGNFPEMREKRDAQGGKHSAGWTRSQLHRPDPAGKAYDKSEWALKRMRGQ